MANHPYNIGDEVLIRGVVVQDDDSDIAVASTVGADESDWFWVPSLAITQSTPTEPGDKSVLLDRHGFSWQRISGEWCQGDVCHTWQYLTEHSGPVKIIHRGGEND